MNDLAYRRAMRWQLLVWIPTSLLIFAICLVIVRHEQVWWWLEVHTGTVNEPGPYYGFWSGFASDLAEYTILVGLIHGLWMAYRIHNCREPRCWRLGHFPFTDAKGVAFKACHRHNPHLEGDHPEPGHMNRRPL